MIETFNSVFRKTSSSRRLVCFGQSHVLIGWKWLLRFLSAEDVVLRWCNGNEMVGSEGGLEWPSSS